MFLEKLSGLFYFIKNIEFKIRTFNKFWFYFNHRRVKFVGARSIIVGENSKIGDGSWLNINDGKKGKLFIGKNCLIGRNNFITVGGDIVIGDFFLSGSNCSIISSSHVINNPLSPYLKSGTTHDNKICIGENVFLGYGVSIVGNVTIGNGCVVGANSVVTKSIKPFTIAVGNPAYPIKEFCFKTNAWVKINTAGATNSNYDGQFHPPLKFIQPLPALRNNLNVY